MESDPQEECAPSAPIKKLTDSNFTLDLVHNERVEGKETPCIVVIDSQNVFVTCTGKEISIWDIETYKLIVTKEVHEKNISNMYYVQEKETLITGDSKNTMNKINMQWEISQKAETDKDGFRCFTYLPQKNWIIAGCDSSITCFDFDTLEIVVRNTDHCEAVMCVLTIPERNVFVTGSFDRDIKVWNYSLENNNILCAKTIQGKGQYVVSLNYFPQLNSILSYNLEDNIFKLWDINTFVLINKQEVEEDPQDILYIKKYDSIFTCDYNSVIRVYSPEKMNEIYKNEENINTEGDDCLLKLDYSEKRDLLFASYGEGYFRVYSFKHK